MPLDLNVPSQLMLAVGPEILLLVGAMALLLVAAWRPESAAHQRLVGIGAVVVTVLTAILVVVYMGRDYAATLGPIAVDDFRWLSTLVFLVGTGLSIAMAIDYNDRESIGSGESHVLMLLAAAGMMFLAAARDLMLVFLGIELMSIAVYAMVGLNRRSYRAAEGALKYFLLGAFSTAFLLYGIALVYGATGSTNIVTIGERIAADRLAGTPMLLLGVGMLVVGFGFKVAAVPFHMWAPDAYEGAPTPVTAFMAASVKAAAFAAFLRVWIEAFGAAYANWHLAVWWLAVVTMIVGNVVALSQRNIKRLLAYSSIAHAGYILVAVVSGTAFGTTAFLFYLLAYTLATMGAFAVVVAIGRAGGSYDSLDEWAGLWHVRPGLAAAMAVFMLALLGFPVFGGIGFFAKWYVLRAALEAQRPQVWLAVVLVLTSVVSAGYYLYVVMLMFMRARRADAPLPAPSGGWTRLVIGASAVAILVLGLWPTPLVDAVARGVPAMPSAVPISRAGPELPGLPAR